MHALSFLSDKDAALSHLYIIEGDKDSVLPILEEGLLARGVEMRGNPMVINASYESFLVEDAKNIRARESERAVNDGHAFFILSALSFAHEAQQSLLKVLEEPRGETHFFLIVPKAEHLLETVRSRGQVISVESDNPLLKEAKKLISLSPKERLDEVKKILTEHEDDESSGKLREYARQLVGALEKIIRKNPADYSKHGIFILEELLMTEKYLATRGANVKLLLEHLMLVI